MHLISPSKVIRGEKSCSSAITFIEKLTQTPLLIGRSRATKNIRSNLFNDLKRRNFNIFQAELKYDCCIEDIERIKKIALSYNCDSIIAAGGGKVLDAGKYISDSLSISSITVPLSASTCAGWTALSNIYSKEGQFIKDIQLKSCPELLIFDHSLIKTAPKKTLRSGIADSLAKWYESSITSSLNNDGLVQQAIQISRVLRDQLFIDGISAYEDNSELSLSWRNVIEGNGLTAGLIGGIGGEKCRTAAAHAIHNAITQLVPQNKPLHGEIVGVGILLQLRLEESLNNNKLANQSIRQLTQFMHNLHLPTSIAELGINIFEEDNLLNIANFACREESEIHFLPFKVAPKDIIDVLTKFEKQKVTI